jgi:hypothetical protein
MTKIMRKMLAGLILPIVFLGLSACGRSDEEALARLKGAMADVKTTAEAVLAGKQPVTRPGLAELVQRIDAADQAVDEAKQTASSLDESSTLRAATLDYLDAVRGAVDQARDRYATAITLDEARAADATVSQSIHQAQDEAALERASAEANAKAGALDAAVSKAGNAVVERERRLESLMTALQRGGPSLAGYPLVSHDALAAAMANNVSATPPSRSAGEQNR